MQAPGMNKLAQPDCTACDGRGKVRVPISFELGRDHIAVVPPTPGNKTQGFIDVRCAACGGSGKR